MANQTPASTQETTDRVREIRAQIDAIAPWPETGDVTALGLARHYAVSAFENAVRDRGVIGSPLYMARLALMCTEFTAAVALAALADPLSPPLFGPDGFGASSPSDLAKVAATQIRDILENSDGIGDWLHEFLGQETSVQLTKLLTELDEATKAAAVDDRPPAAPAEPKPGRLARVEVKGFRDLGIVRVTETTLAGEAMLHAECDDGSSADFPPSSLHFITWLPDDAETKAVRIALPAGEVRTCGCRPTEICQDCTPGVTGRQSEEGPF